MSITSSVCIIGGDFIISLANKWKGDFAAAADWDHPRFGFDNYIVSNLDCLSLEVDQSDTQHRF
jgi:hypothetical protein